MKRLSIQCVVILISILCLPFHSLSQGTAEHIDNLMNQYHAYGLFNGSVLVAEQGRVILKKGFGLANMEWNIPNGPDTKFRIGSITKQFTSMLILQLVSEGKLQLDDPLSKHLPGYREDTGKRITIHHLLTHSSGIPSYTELPRFFEDVSRDPFAIDAFIREYCSGDLEFTPGEQFRYNNSGYFLLGAIIERLTGQLFREALREHIFDPLKMENTGYDRHSPIIKNRAAGYEKRITGVVNAPYLDMSIPYSAGALYSTVEDMYLWDRALYSHTLLPRKWMALLFEPHIPYSGAAYGYGWVIGELQLDNGKKIQSISHGGGINGFNTIIVRLVKDEHLIVLFNNTGGTNLREMSEQIACILYDRDVDAVKKPLTGILYDKFMSGGIKAAIRHYHDLKTDAEEDYDFREPSLNLLGYVLLGMDEIEAAIEIFKLNAQAYPESFNVYDSLGDAYLELGDKTAAIQNFARSLELNPNNHSAIEKMSRLIDER